MHIFKEPVVWYEMSQNRGAFFTLHRNHFNCVAGGKRPYHTIMSALLTDSPTNSQKPRLLAALGVMGALMQPQGHVQVFYLSLDRYFCLVL